jgi:AcrR family transcriptional regulator
MDGDFNSFKGAAGGEEGANPGLRQRQKERTRAKVLSSARELIERDGYEAVTVRMIAEHAGVAVGSVFTSFTGKADLLEELIVEDLAMLTAAAEAALLEGQANGRPTAGLIEAMFAPSLEYDLAHLTKVREALAFTWLRPPASDKRLRNAVVPGLKLLARVLEHAKANGELVADADIHMLTETIFTLYHTNLRKAVYDGWGAPQLTALLNAQVAALLGGSRA